MKHARVLSLMLALVLVAGAAAAQPADFRVVTGTLVYPDTVRADSPFAVIRGSDRTYYADLSAARPTAAVSAGQPVTVVGYQGREPDQLVALGLEPAATGAVPGAPAGPAPAGSAPTGLNLPPNHHYEAYDATTGQSITPLIPPGGQGYTPINPAQIPGFVAQGLWIYDRTAQKWVHHPSVGGINPEYRGAAVAGTPATPGPATSAPGQWARVHGTVQSVSGSALQLRADDGRTLSVDMAQVNPEVRQALRPQEGVTVIGFPRDGHRFEARYIQQDASDPARGGVVVGRRAAPAAGPVDEQAWQRERGVVQSIEGNTLRFRAQDGRTVTADVQQVNAAVRRALGPGDEVTVVGFYRGNRNTMSARYVQQEGAAAASPRMR